MRDTGAAPSGTYPESTDFAKLAERAISRRLLLGTGAAFGVSTFVIGAAALQLFAARAAGRMGFEPIAANALDTVTVPKGYRWQVVARWGDPLWSDAPDFDPQTRGTGTSQERAMGDNNDGMALFSREGHTVLAVNNEYANLAVLHANRLSKKPETPDDVRKSKAAHGITIVEIARQGRVWSIVKDSPYNRRITGDTPMEITGPARGHDLLKTAADPVGATVNGTFNNCGSGLTPWGTYLACEENFNGYFSSSDPAFALSAAFKRYGIGHTARNPWALADARFDIAKHPNEPNRFGYVVEVDALDPGSTPKKRTALGRFKHENAEVVVAADGRVVVYMGDDEAGEYLYRFVSDGRYVEGGNNADLLDAGRLYAARFEDGGKGAWIELTPEATGMASPAEVCIHTRLAASKVGATTMDRPEWVAANPLKPEAYCCLTNNKVRGVKPNAGGDATPVGGPNPRKANPYGQIVRWRPAGGDHAAPRFDWDLFVVAGNPAVHGDAFAGSPNVTKDNMFNGPDGLAFDPNGLLWIQTDGNYSDQKDFAGHGNNQMLVGDPATGEIRRFLVGPKECEVTGFAWSPDRRTLFVGIQHPGERGNSHFPGGGDTVPRSSIIAITKDDGGPVV
jgi:secreted PhoX family phosphatase